MRIMKETVTLLPAISYTDWQWLDSIEKSKGHQKGIQGTGVIDWKIRGTGSVFLNPISGREG